MLPCRNWGGLGAGVSGFLGGGVVGCLNDTVVGLAAGATGRS